ncbi:Ig-like domain-containing protein [Sulfurimonas sp.]|uniref:Ig-like domain-containing protein n=1 Tax=Sulfurimonas sp. TaxID=2022749 RepID=UPI002AAFE966|nr:Ig-like domain-containing protein [Sulfurimonas sp.]
MIGLREEGKEFSELSNTLSYDYSTTEPGHGASLFLSTGNQLEQGLSSVGYEIATRAFATVTAKDDNIVVYRNNSTILNPLSNDIDGAGSYGDGFSIKITSEPMYGQVIVNDDNTLTYIPNENQFGVDTIIYVATNLDGREDTGTITLDHIDNAAPITSDDNIATSSNKAVIIDVLANDTDQDGDQLSISITSSPRYGTVTVTKDNQVVYTPYDNYFGEDSFSYIALDDKEGVSNEATVAIIVNNSLAAAVIDSSEGSFINPSISRVNDNLFVTTWSSYSEEAVKVQLFNGQGEKIGEPFIANTTKDAFYDLKSYVIPLSNGEFYC